MHNAGSMILLMLGQIAVLLFCTAPSCPYSLQWDFAASPIKGPVSPSLKSGLDLELASSNRMCQSWGQPSETLHTSAHSIVTLLLLCKQPHLPGLQDERPHGGGPVSSQPANPKCARVPPRTVELPTNPQPTTDAGNVPVYFSRKNHLAILWTQTQ